MSEDLLIWAACGEFSVPLRAWRMILNLGYLYGWTPHGTEPRSGWLGWPPELEWRVMSDLHF